MQLTIPFAPKMPLFHWNLYERKNSAVNVLFKIETGVISTRMHQDFFQEEGDSGLLPTIQDKFEGDFLLQLFLYILLPF